MRITKAEAADLFTGTGQRPLQVVRVTLVNDGPGMVRDPATLVSVRVEGPGVTTPRPFVRAAFELVRLHLDLARRDPDYKFVLAEIDYLKPYFDSFPQDREDLRRLMAEGRVEIVGGNYNEPNTNLISAEAAIRNAVYGIGFQRDVFGGDPRSARCS